MSVQNEVLPAKHFQKQKPIKVTPESNTRRLRKVLSKMRARDVKGKLQHYKNAIGTVKLLGTPLYTKVNIG
jgi:hypothetical protein